MTVKTTPPTPEAASRSQNMLLVVTNVIGVLLSLLGCLIVVAWYLHNPAILQINPSYVPMQFNTALAFLATGVSLCLAAQGKQTTAALIGSIAGILGLLTMLEYLFGVSLGIDQLLMRTYIMTTIKYPGRMAPSAAFCFLLTSIAFWLSRRATVTRKWSLVGIIGSVIASLGAIGVLGYFTNLPVTFVWANFSSMAIHTAISFVILGAALVAHTVRNETLLHIESGVWRAAAVALATLTIFVGTSQAMFANEESSLQSKTEVVAQAETAQVQTTLELHMQAIERMAERSEVRLPNQTEWEADASNYLAHAKGVYDAIEWLDSSYRVRWMIAPAGSDAALTASSDLSYLFDGAKLDRRVKLVRAISARGGNSKFLILAPIYRMQVFEGMIVAVVNPSRLFEKMQTIAEKPYGFSVMNGSEILYSSKKKNKDDREIPWVQSVKGKLGDVEWTMQVWPIDSSYTSGPWFVLLAGILSASALTVLVLKSQAVNARLRELFTIIDTAPIGMLVLDSHGLVKQINREGEKLFGYAREEIQGKPVSTIIPGMEQLGHATSADSLIAQPARCRRKNNSEVFTEVGINHILIEAEQYVLVVVTDISQKKRAEEELQTKSTDLMRSNKELVQLQHLLQTTIDHMPALVGSWDTSFRNRFANRAYINWFGQTPEQMRGKYMWEIIGEERFELIRPHLLSVLQGKTEVFERTIEYANGEVRHGVFSYVPDIEDGVIKGYYGFVSDISLLKQAQIAKDNVLTQLQDIIDAARDFAIIETDKSGMITLFSRGAELLLGYTAQEIVGKAHIDIFHLPQEVAARSKEVTEKLGWKVEGFNADIELANLGDSTSYDWTYVHKDRSTILVNLTIAAVHDKLGNITGYLGIAKDIRKEKEILHALADARDKAQSANLAKSQFLANMSHEIRTPMNAILGMLQLLQHTELTTRQLDYAIKTQSAAQALLGLLNDILDFSKVEADKLVLEHAPFRLDTLMRDLSVIFSSNVGSKEIDILFSLDPQLPALVIGDEMRLRQVLINLAGNAIKFTKHGSVIVSLSVIARDKLHSTIIFAVQDSGIGIDSEQLNYVFEGFSQAEASTTRRFGGTGLGLAISQRLVSLMGGKLEVESTINVGSRFYFSLTLQHAPENINIERHSLTNSSMQPIARRVLIVDDSAAAREILESMVLSLGWDADIADSGKTALTMLQHNETNQLTYDVIFMDWKMPGMDGLETAIKIRQSARKDADTAIIIMVTAHDREILAKKLRHDSIVLNGFLIKPVTASMLYDAVANATQESSLVVPPQNSLRLAGLRLLVVEDNLINQEVARALLNSEGAEVEVANDGREGITKVLERTAHFDAVLMDIQMPVMDGYEASRILRQHEETKSLPIIATTANAMSGDKEACLAAGMNDHVAKPIVLEELVSTILRCCKAGTKHANTHDIITPHKTHQTPTIHAEIDLDGALKRLGGNTALFIKLAARFGADVAVMITDFRQHMEQHESAKAEMVMHTLKGVAGTVGATSLAEHAARIETLLKTGDTDFDTKALLHELETHATDTRSALEIINIELNASTLVTHVQTADTSTIDTLFDELETLLQGDNMQALNVFLKLQEKLGDKQKDQLLALAASINKLDFKQSLQHSKQLRSSLR